ncbi:MAG: serine/threonine protein kinase [Candidatus Eremiobacteraeota bacterium]|nr:serine/threonine protein kinase [Candidatus Eremiobacteraeota bacterium]MCW5866823.1 serine/threonine protein kinase [Candidatus Eremiobacteraeota bacterium]
MSRPASTQGRFSAGLPMVLRESTLQRLSVSARILVAAIVLAELLTLFDVWRGAQPFLWGVHFTRLLTLGVAALGARYLDKTEVPALRRLRAARLGLLVLSACVAFQECYYWSTGAAGGISRVSLFASLAPVLIPDALWRSLGFSVLLLLTVPLAHWVAQLVGLPALAGADLVLLVLRHLIAVGAAWMAAATVNQLRDALTSEYGSYKLMRKLGQGGFGEVWEAVHRHHKRTAAIKLIRHDCDDATATRFLREAETLSQLECPHTVRLYDYGHSESGQLFLVMELLKGVDLENLVKTHGPQPPERVTSLLAQACLSLEEAHGRQLIHRDIKPANLFLCQLGMEPDFVKLLDFGLVKPEGANLTQSDALVGTPDYMSPEQIQGRELDGRSDLYSLGAVGYFLLTGCPLFEQKGNPMNVLMGHLTQVPATPSTRLGIPISPELETIVMRCLQKEPSQRYSSARDLYKELLALPGWSRPQAAAWWAEHAS